MNEDQEVIARIRDLLDVAEWKDAVLARKIGLTRGAVHHWFKKGKIPSEQIASIAEALNVTEGYLRFGTTVTGKVDATLLAQCVVAINEACDRLGVKASPQQTAKAIAYFYQDQVNGNSPTENQIDSLLEVLLDP